MFDSLSEIKTLFEKADAIISEQPDLLSKSTDEIFQQFKNDNDDMISIRWGIMARAKIASLQSFEISNIISFLADIKDRNILCGYIGYILQQEYHINLISLLLEAFHCGQYKNILPFVKDLILHESKSFIDELYSILSIISDANKTDKYTFINNYSELIISHNEESYIFDKFLLSDNNSLKELLYEICRKLTTHNISRWESWIDIFLKSEQERCKLVGIYLIERSLQTTTTLFDNNFLYIEELCNTHSLWLALIPSYVRYIASDNELLYCQTVKDRLIVIKNSPLDIKIKYIDSIRYQRNYNQNIIDITNEFLTVSFEMEEQILGGLDYFFEQLCNNDILIAFDKLNSVFTINEYGINYGSKDFFDEITHTKSILAKKQNAFIGVWLDKFLNGNSTDFYFAIALFFDIISIKKLEEYLKTKPLTYEQTIDLLDGVTLFSFNIKKTIALVFTLSQFVDNNDSYFKYCIDNIYSNYPGEFISAAEKLIETGSKQQVELSKQIISHDTVIKDKIKKCHSDKDFKVPSERMLAYYKLQQSQTKRINEDAEKRSIFASFFRSSKMKYGKRIAYYQIDNEHDNFKVQEYTHFHESTELPQAFLNDPVTFYSKRMNYLNRKNKNAINN